MFLPAHYTVPFLVESTRFSFGGPLSPQILAHVVPMELTVLPGSRETHVGSTGKEVLFLYKILGVKIAILITFEDKKLENKASVEPSRAN